MSGERLLYIYGVVDEAPAELGLGLEGEPLRAVTEGPVAAVVSAHDRAPEAEEDELWQHEAVVERLMEDAAVLPMRFGTTVADAKQVEELLRAREEELVESLAAVRGAVELSVRAELSAAEAKERLHEPLRELSRRSLAFEARDAHGGEDGFRGAYLVDAERVEAFAQRVDGLVEELGGEVSCTGPWPPYSFVRGTER